MDHIKSLQNIGQTDFGDRMGDMNSDHNMQNSHSPHADHGEVNHGNHMVHGGMNRGDMMEISVLPGEILMRVLSWLLPRDLKMIVLVCKYWRIMGEDPSLWKLFIPMVRNRDHINNLSSKRMQNIQGIFIDAYAIRDWSNQKYKYWQDGDYEELFRAMTCLPKLKELVWRDFNNLSSVEPRVFAKVVIGLEVVDLGNTCITEDHVQAIMTAMSQNSRLKILLFPVMNLNLSSVDPADLSRAVTTLEEVDLTNCGLTTNQIKFIFAHVSEDSKLKKLILGHYGANGGYDISSVAPTVLATAVNRLEEIDLGWNNMTTEQLTCVFTHVQEDTKLKKLRLCHKDFSKVAPLVLATAVNRLEEFDLFKLTTEQLTCIISNVKENSKLKKLQLSRNDLSKVDPAVLAASVSRMEEVDLEFTKLNTEQLTHILSRVQEDTKLKKLSLRRNQTVDVDLDVVRKAREKLGERLLLDEM